jgi:mono/diheme cytochrome c family protein
MQQYRFLLIVLVILLERFPTWAGFQYFDPTLESEIPTSLSATGIYSDIVHKKMLDEAVPYEVNTPLWSDGAFKERFLLLPPGTFIGFNDSSDYYTYPDRAIFIKNFSLDTLQGNRSSRILWETRLMINKKKNGYDVWYGFSYKWNKDQNDALLVPDEGLDTAINNYYPGRMVDGKVAITKKWTFPKRNQCRLCHVSIAPGAFNLVQPGENQVRTRSVLGFFTAQINKEIPGANGQVNQIQNLFQRGIFGKQPAPKNIANLPRWRAIEDETASLEVRARSYIAANCSGCHGTRANLNNVVFGLSQVDNALNYDYQDMAEHMDYKNKALSKDFGNGSPYLLWPGLTDKSTLWFRQSQRNLYDDKFSPVLAQMPPLGTYETDTLALKVIRRWIDGMPTVTPDPLKAKWVVAPQPVPEVPNHMAIKRSAWNWGNPIIINGDLIFPGRSSMVSEKILSLYSVNGAPIQLKSNYDGVFCLPEDIATGIYFGRMLGNNFSIKLIRE